MSLVLKCWLTGEVYMSRCIWPSLVPILTSSHPKMLVTIISLPQSLTNHHEWSFPMLQPYHQPFGIFMSPDLLLIFNFQTLRATLKIYCKTSFTSAIEKCLLTQITLYHCKRRSIVGQFFFVNSTQGLLQDSIVIWALCMELNFFLVHLQLHM